MVNKTEDISKEAITINVQSLFIPFAIIIVGIMVSGALYFGLQNNNSAKKSDSTQVGNNQADDAANTTDTTNDTPDEPTTATTSIDDDPVMGNRESAKVAIVEFADFECPYCKRHFEETFGDIKKKYIDTGKAIYVYRDLPLSFHDPAATSEALAAECVQDLAGDTIFYQYHDLIFEKTQGNGSGVGGSNTLANLAAQVGVDKGSFTTCLKEEKFKDEVEKDSNDAQLASISGTPGFVIGLLQDDGTVEGTIIRGAYPFSEFERVLDALL